MNNIKLGKKWTDGQPVNAGDYMDVRIIFTPEEITYSDKQGNSYKTLSVYNNTKGVGRFAQGQIFGLDDKKRPVSIKITGKLGNPANENKSSKSSSVAQVL